MTSMDFEDALHYMQGLRRFGIKLGNDRFEALLARLGSPHRKYGIAHIAGTKGKGSTTALIASLLHAHGFRVGGYFSPYVYDVRERVQINGAMIEREAFARLVTSLRPHIEELAQTELGQTTEFELKTAIAFCYFAEKQVDYAAVEVGIGGRLDATNVVLPLVGVITNIGLDHTQILGDTHAKIAAEKAGIIKPHLPILTAADEPSAWEVIRRTAAEREAPLLRVLPGSEDARPDEIRWYPEDPNEEIFTVRTPNALYAGLRLGLRGAYQRINAACAVGAVEQMARTEGFAMDIEAVREGVRLAYLPGRLEIAHEKPLVVLDGAHNAMAAQALAEEVRRLPKRRLLLVVGMLEGHEPEEFLHALAPLADAVYATQPTWQRGQPVERIAAAARRYCAEVHSVTPPLEAARAAVAAAAPDDLVLVTGSFYTVGDVSPAHLFPRP